MIRLRKRVRRDALLTADRRDLLGDKSGNPNTGGRDLGVPPHFPGWNSGLRFL
jgi:hypothetical protein